MSMNDHRYNDADRAAIYRVIDERRDMRHFVPGVIPAEQLQSILEAAHHAPSVGFMQPWRFIRITDPALRAQIAALVEQERQHTADALQQRRDEFLRLKVEGIRECGELLVGGLMEGREQHIFGRRTLPEMDIASFGCAIQNMWLAARAEGLGLGWVSLFDPDALAQLLNMPEGSRPLAILCIGRVAQFYPRPMLELEGWRQGEPLTRLLFENRWGQRNASEKESK